MDMSKIFTAQRKVSREEFMEMSQAGIRELFDLEHYKVLDGSTGEEVSHFVYNTETHDCYLIDLRASYELLAAFYCGGDKATVKASIEKIASSVE
ncbi:hypothetical protein [Alkalicoccus saliphilus]|jgi:hypothetical protein|uniref:Uncharacterized protein n=1 Tax=Alkalicoccus saliphilus TaxID=200989 RepID=A0A2T4U4G4_9BACI|nr:hypothetical protein [Alkalicoccus saliphilus]PTL38291.1 hypothetical protein C6Y45_12260 [Alkalicoccus saliphilus]